MNTFDVQFLEKLNLLISNTSDKYAWVQNLICTILGTVCGALITVVIQHTGRIHFYINKVEKWGEEKNCEGTSILFSDFSSKSLSGGKIEIVIDFYNSKQMNIPLRKVSFYFMKGKEKSKCFYLSDKNAHDVITVINLSPQMVSSRTFTITLNKNEIMYLKSNEWVPYIFYTIGNQQKKIKLNYSKGDNDECRFFMQ